MVKCLICPTRQSSKYYEPFSFHVIPKPEELRLKWLRAIGKQEHEISRSDVICCEHFDPTDILEAGRYGTRRLKKGTIPKRKLGKRGKEYVKTLIKNSLSYYRQFELPLKLGIEESSYQLNETNYDNIFNTYIADAARPLNESSTRDEYLNLPIKKELEDELSDGTSNNCSETFSQKYVEDDGYLDLPIKAEPKDDPYPFTTDNINNFSVPLKSINEVEECPYQLTETNINICVRVPSKNTNKKKNPKKKNKTQISDDTVKKSKNIVAANNGTIKPVSTIPPLHYFASSHDTVKKSKNNVSDNNDMIKPVPGIPPLNFFVRSHTDVNY